MERGSRFEVRTCPWGYEVYDTVTTVRRFFPSMEEAELHMDLVENELLPL